VIKDMPSMIVVTAQIQIDTNKVICHKSEQLVTSIEHAEVLTILKEAAFTR